jgi:TP901 family phage tail tape measure protein
MANGNDLKLRVLFDMIDGATKPLRNIMNGNKELARSLRESRDELGKLQRTQKDIAAFREMRVGLLGAKRDMQGAQARVAELARTISSTDSPTKKMVAEFEKAKRTAAQLTAAHDQQAEKVRALRDRLAGAGIDTRNLSQHERELRSSMAATIGVMTTQQNKLADLTSRTKRLAEARERMNKTKELAGSMAGTGAKMMASGAVVGAATLVPVAAYAKAEDSATQLASALMRAGGIVPPEFEKINALAMRLGDRLPGTTSDFQDMMTMLTRQGISAKTILGGMGEATAYLAVQLKKAPAEAAEFTAKLQDATRTTEKDMLSLTDVIQKAFMLGVDDNNMLDGFSKLAPAMDTIKQKGLEGAKALAPLLVMADQSGLVGGSAGNAFRKVFQLGMDPKKVAKANKELAPAQRLDFTNGKGEFGGLDKMFAQLGKLKGLDTQKRLGVTKEIFGDDAETLQAVSLMIEKGKAGYDEVLGKMAAQASMQERVNKQLGTLKNLWDAATGTFTNGLVAFGESIAPEIKGVVEWLGDMSQRMGQWARDNPNLANGLMKVAAVIAIVMTVIGGLLVVLAAVLAPIGAIAFAFSALGAIGFATVGIFAGVAVGIVAAIAAIGVAVYTYWEPIKAFFSGLWSQVQQAFAGGLAGIGALILNWSPLGLFYSAFAAVLQWFGVDMPARFSEFGSNLIAGLVNGITSGLGAVQAAINNVAASTVGWFKEKLGIHSPSRVFGELGGFITQGAALGMESEQARIAKAAVGLATLAATSFAVPGAQAAGMPTGRDGVMVDTRPAIAAAPVASLRSGGDTYNYNITIAAKPGMDEKALARAMRAEIERVERERRTRHSSRLSD